MRVSKRDLKASICKDSFYDFVKRFWEVIIPEEPVWNWHIKVICDELQEAAERVFKGLPKKHDLLINVPPGTTKSTICSVMFPAWVWTQMPSCRTICVSYAHSLALTLSIKTRDIVQSDKWRELFGDVNLREDQNTKGLFANKAGGSRLAVGVEGSVTGHHAHFIIIDDPLDPEQAVSEADLIRVNRFVETTLPTRKVDKTVTPTIQIMQRLHQDDPSARMLARRKKGAKIRHINLPGIFHGSGRKSVRPRKLARFYKEGLLDPVRLGREALKELEAQLGQYGYAGQILQTPTPPGGGMFKVERIRLDDPPANVNHLGRRVRYWDKAATEGGGAWTAGILMAKTPQGRFWILDVVRGQWASDVREAIILQTAQLDGSRVEIGIEQEPGSGGKDSALATAKNLAGFRVTLHRPTGDKVIRADTFSVQVNSENTSMRKADWNKDYVEELRFFPKSTYKDQVDASSGAFGMLTKHKVRVGALRRSKTA